MMVYIDRKNKGISEEVQKKNDQLLERCEGLKLSVFSLEEIRSFLLEHTPTLLRVFDYINSDYPAAQADFFRYVYIYLKGGLYLDIKSGFKKCPFDYVDKHYGETKCLFVSHWDRG